MITIQNIHPINVLLPTVYRYIDEEYIEQFFNEGKLRLGSFKRFKKYPDEQKGDKSEGNGAFISHTKEGNQIVGVTNAGENSYILCTSTIESNQIMENFKTTGYFKITDPLEFCIAIANCLPGFTQSYQGFCNYKPYRLIDKEISGLSNKDFTNEKGEIIIGSQMLNILGQQKGNGTDLMFLKDMSYQEQNEYRFIWEINSSFYEIHDYIDICCKEAVKYCEKLKE